ncbi:MAG: PH domain-containing protein, partial [Actinomycetota bacterium]|nr:PH domain-containing protein [Actinomycetota bacterium]
LVVAAAGAWVLLVVPLLVLAGAALWWWWVPRYVASWRYAERDEDLLVSRGRLVRRLTVVPYGRMQVIDVEAGPLDSRLGIATVRLVTASASTDAEIPGLPADVAHDLRNRLAARGETRAAGL